MYRSIHTVLIKQIFNILVFLYFGYQKSRLFKIFWLSVYFCLLYVQRVKYISLKVNWKNDRDGERFYQTVKYFWYKPVSSSAST